MKSEIIQRDYNNNRAKFGGFVMLCGFWFLSKYSTTANICVYVVVMLIRFEIFCTFDICPPSRKVCPQKGFHG